jgi:hypothetical protein
MPFQWKDIVQDWLLGTTLDYETDEIVDAFNEVERIMGSEWLVGQTRGAMDTIRVVDLGKTLIDLGKIDGGENLISKIAKNYPLTTYHGKEPERLDSLSFQYSNEMHELAHAIAVARHVTHYRKKLLEVELEPELSVKTKIKHPDFRVKYDDAWVYVEVVCPSFSEEAQSIYRIEAEIAKVHNEIRMDRVIEVYLFRDPTQAELDQILEKCKSLAESDVQPQEYAIEEVAQIFTNPWNQERLPTFAPAVEEKRPLLCFGSLNFSIKEGVSHGRKCFAKMPFTDERSQRILGRESLQLSKEQPGLIIVDVSSVAGGLKRWPELLARRLQPSLNSRVGGILVTESSISGKSMKTEKRFVEHPNPIHPLPRGFITITTSV